MFSPNDRVLLAVSGGIDSVAMAHTFHRVGQSFAIAHVNYGLRGADSDDDALFVQNIADRYRVPFHQTRFDTATVAQERGISIQMAARELRYAWFEQLLDQYGYASVATAHHQNDVLETILINLVRGTGLAGLQGIPVRQGRVIRPLWFTNREQLVAYMQEHNLSWREDSSNAADKYVRNRLRHQVLPILQVLNPALLTDTLPQTVERLRAAGQLLSQELAQSWQQVAVEQEGRITLNIEALIRLSEPQFRLYEWLRIYGFSQDQVRQIWAATMREPGSVFWSATHRLVHEREGLVLMPLPPEHGFRVELEEWPQGVVVAGSWRLCFETFDKPVDFQIPTDPGVACLDADQIKLPLIIRPWQQGDRFRPLGLKGSKLVSDLLNDQKVSLSQREQAAVLAAGNGIMWVVGRRIGHAFRLTAETRRVLKIVLS
ncbi:tRNA lysidine(34) synthetase TilS [Nibrella saemangeumensis]|uniref:tRNA(Ile)-lysidine synthase n=1 Tax=Nibrella saemangeumensis TaxID=1084526 RepID=A0ABP8MV36_9BACT